MTDHLQAHPGGWLAEGRASAAGASVQCPTCGHGVPPGELRSHELAHEEALMQGSEHQVHYQDIVKRVYWEELSRRYSLEASFPAGACQLCGSTAHWVQDCALNPDNIEAQARIIEPPGRHAILLAQRPDPQWCGSEIGHLMELIAAACLARHPPGSGKRSVTTLLCGPVRHFGGQRYRNMQMQISSLLARRRDAREVLFGGCGYVPDIPSMQAWIECAWQQGFDLQGSEQLGQKLQAQRKWVGTTDCATLLRYFGIPAAVIDFGETSEITGGRGRPSEASNICGGRGGAVVRGVGTHSSGEQADGHGAASAAPPPAAAGSKGLWPAKERTLFGSSQGLQEEHPGVECDGCGDVGFTGPRYRSEIIPDFDLCGPCHQLQCHPAAAPFRRAAAWRPRGGGADGAAVTGEDGSLGQALLEWVWRYFAAPDEAAEGTPIGKRPARGGAPSVVPASAPGVTLTGRSPLYFQHEGHSRTIVGVECRQGGGGGRGEKEEYFLLVLDPATAPAALAAALRAHNDWERLLKRGVQTLRRQQYQLLYCPSMSPVPPGTHHYESLKPIEALERWA